ncbi:MAG: M24 family metallopeptidase [Planctomycetota bacterium]|jgi:Xaa-Pro aminopeptidase
MAAKPNLLHYADSESDADMFYATRFFAPDPFAWFTTRGRSYVIASDLEIGRARSEAGVDTVLSMTAYRKRAVKAGARRPNMADILVAALKHKKVRSVLVPDRFPLGMAEALRKRGIRVRPRGGIFFPERLIKTREEIRHIERAQRATEKAVHKAFRRLKRAKVKGNRIMEKGRALTAEDIKQTINVSLTEDACVAKNAIVACGEQAVDPHNRGTGPLEPNKPIIFDVFPRSAESLYWADMSRTVVKGKASDAVRELYAAVKDGQQLGCDLIKEGVNGKDVHKAIHDRFEELGFKTRTRKGTPEGFFHGTGHGVGLDIHENPRVGGVDDILQSGAVVTVEPGLYYPGLGGVRIEDMVLVQKRGCRNLTDFTRELLVL